MPWPPGVEDPLPRAADAWYERSKLKWILDEKGHGDEWARVFHVGPEDQERVWEVIANAMPRATIKEVRRSTYGVTCGVEVILTIDGRSARTLVSWHYAIPIAAPRLVTAYPTP
jgi:hypothetical protein